MRRPRHPRLAALLSLLLLAAACGTDTAAPAAISSLVSAGRSVEATVAGSVTRVLPDGSGREGPHQRFEVDDGSGATVEVDHNLTLAPRAPVQPGVRVVVHGRFEPDPGHPVIHETHHSTGGGREGGWIEVGGRRYQ